jgi:hypothetical protein
MNWEKDKGSQVPSCALCLVFCALTLHLLLAPSTLLSLICAADTPLTSTVLTSQAKAYGE